MCLGIERNQGANRMSRMEVGHCEPCCKDMEKQMGEVHTNMGCFNNPLVEHAPTGRCTTNHLLTECNTEGTHIFASICKCEHDKEKQKTKQINEITNQLDTTVWPYSLTPKQIKQIKELSK